MMMSGKMMTFGVCNNNKSRGVMSVCNKNKSRGMMKMNKTRKITSFVPKRIVEPAKKYGTTFVGIYYAVYFTTLGSMYVAVDSGVVVPRDATSKLSEWGWTVDEINPKQGSLFAAWILTKFTEPLRAAFTLVITPPVANRLRKFYTRSNASWSPRGIAGILVSVLAIELVLLRYMGNEDEENIEREKKKNKRQVDF
jgi:hypothetical protein